MRHAELDLTQVRTYSIVGRTNLVGETAFSRPPADDLPELASVAEQHVIAHAAGAAVIWHLGGHVIKCGLGPVVVDLLERGIVTHVSSNGAATIHDFEIALQGQTSEDVAASIEDGSFGMAEETGALMNEAIRAGARDGLGMGAALGRFIDEDPRFEHRHLSVLHAAHRLGLPYTVHVAIGTDIIHQHPTCDFAATGTTSGRDFRILAASVAKLEGGVFANIGSAVIGPEVFLKALSVARNLGHEVSRFMTVNFDLLPLDSPNEPSSPDEPEYYYRPKKNVVIRPTSLGGVGLHVCGDHRQTLPALSARVQALLPDEVTDRSPATVDPRESLAVDHPRAAQALQELMDRHPRMQPCGSALAQAFRAVEQAQRCGGTLFACGNGGSFADAQHIAGELDKSMSLPRPLPQAHRTRLAPTGLDRCLEAGLRTVALGSNPALSTAVANDIDHPALVFAQELYALARPGDVLLGLTTRGRSRNVLAACQVGQTLGVTTVAISGGDGGPVAQHADVAVLAPGASTPEIQESHRLLYHALCDMLEREAFGR